MRSRGLAILVGLVLAVVVVTSAAFATRRGPDANDAEGPGGAHGSVAPMRVQRALPPTWGHYAPPGFGEMAFAPDGTLYVADCFDGRIYRVTPGRPGVTKVVGGRGPGGFASWTKLTKVGWLAHHEIKGDGEHPTNAVFNCPVGMDFDAAGNLYIADLNNDRIREISTDNFVSTFAGIGPAFDNFGPWSPGVGKRAGDGGPASHGILDRPLGIEFDTNGNLYVVDRDHEAVRKIDTNGIITTVAGTGVHGYNGDHMRATEAELWRPNDVAFDAAGNLYISDQNNRRVRLVDHYGMITTVGGNGKYACGGDGGPATKASFRNPGDIVFLPDGSLLMSDGECHNIRRIAPDGTVSTYAGGGDLLHPCQGILGAPVAQLPIKSDVPLQVTPQGDLLISDGACHDILLIGSDGIVHMYAHAPSSDDAP